MDGGEGHSWIFSFWGLHGPEQRRTLDSIRQNRFPLRTVWFRERFTGTLLKHSPATPLNRIVPLYTRYIISHYDICYPAIGFHGTTSLRHPPSPVPTFRLEDKPGSHSTREGEERSPALRGRRLTRPSNFLYMILYIGGGHTAGCAVLAFVPFQ